MSWAMHSRPHRQPPNHPHRGLQDTTRRVTGQTCVADIVVSLLAFPVVRPFVQPISTVSIHHSHPICDVFVVNSRVFRRSFLWISGSRAMYFANTCNGMSVCGFVFLGVPSLWIGLLYRNYLRSFTRVAGSGIFGILQKGGIFWHFTKESGIFEINKKKSGIFVIIRNKKNEGIRKILPLLIINVGASPLTWGSFE